MAELHHAPTPTLEIAYEQTGPPEGRPVLLLHGWPYSPRSYDAAVEKLHAEQPGLRLIVPFLRGFGPTRYRSAGTMRSGQQAALGQDVVDLMDALAIRQATLVGFDWGGRAACVAAALWPERVEALLSVDGYAIQDIAKAAETPAQSVEQEHQLWSQWYFQTERGRAGLQAHRRAIAHKLWEMWSPTSPLNEALFAASAACFDNPDFVATTIHSYRHRYGRAPDDPALASLERQLAAQPRISVPTQVVHGAEDRVRPPALIEPGFDRFTGPFGHRELAGVGHCPPQESPVIFANAVLDLLRQAR